MTRLARLRVALDVILGIALVVSIGMFLRRSQQLANSERQRATDQQSIRELQEALHKHELQKAPAVEEKQAQLEKLRAVLTKRDATIAQLNSELSVTQTNLTNLQSQLSLSNDQNTKALATAEERYRKEQGDLQSKITALKQELNSTKAELQASRQRITSLQTNNSKLRANNSQGSIRSAEVKRLVENLQDINRHRDAYITSIMNRYSNITSEFRAMSGMIDSGRDQNSSPLSEAALTRIQNAISLADNDFQQLTQLNAAAHQIEKKLAKK